MTQMTAPASRAATVRRDLFVTALATGLAIAIGYMMPQSGSEYRTPAWAVWIHLATVIPALPLGAWILWKPKGTRAHKMGGRIWAAMMLITAIDSFWIRSLTGGFSPIHIFSVLTLVSVPIGIWHIKNGRIDRHINAMRGVYIGLCTAGLFSVMPGRLMGNLIFG